ncbi:MAG: TolC family protein [Betaproteobacteria bacterium]
MNRRRPGALVPGALVLGAWVLGAAAASAQLPQPAEKLTFQAAIDRAERNNPSVAAAAAGILRAESLLRQARAATLLQVNGTVTTTTLNRGVSFDGNVVSPRNSITASLTADMPVVAAAAWAQRAQAGDQQHIAELSVAEARRQIALATADAYLTVIASHRVLEANQRARDVAKAHADLADQLEQKGSGSRLNALRAHQQWSTDEGLLESSRLALYRSQEALGVLVVANEPVDADGEPSFDVPAEPTPATDSLLLSRTDLKLFSARTQAAERVVRDSRKDYWPSLSAIFQPSTTHPSQFFVPANSWRFMLQAAVPLFDSGQRAGLKVERQAALEEARAALSGAATQAASEVRSAREAVASSERSLATARDAADAAQQVVTITNVSFRAGAATNIEVIDAERSARDADTAVAVAEDTLRRAKLELLTALGRFPQ